MQFLNLGTQSDDGSQWQAHLKWITVFADRLVLDTGTEQINVPPGMGERNIAVTAPHMVLHLTAYHDKESVTRSLDVYGPSDVGTQKPSPEPAPVIDRFEETERVDTSIGSAVRLYYHTTQNAELHLQYRDQDVPLSSDSDHIDFFVTRRITVTLKAISPVGAAPKELTLAPNPTLDTEPGSQQTGPRLHDDIDIVSGAAQLRDFNTLAVDSEKDPLCGWLLNVLRAAHKQDLSVYRNAVCARHGYDFHSSEFTQLFRSKPWYHPDTSVGKVIDSRFTPLERSNVYWLLKQQRSASE